MSACSASDSPNKSRANSPSWLLYGMPALALAIPIVPSQVLLPDFYAGHTAVELAAVGLALLAARCIDIFTDPIIGRLTDQALARGKGLRRIIMAGGLICGYSLYMLFAPPPSADWGYLLVWSAFLFTGWSVIQIPYLVYSARLTGGQARRLKLNASREGFGLAGILLAALFAAFWPSDDTSEMLRDLAIATLVLGGIFLFIFVRAFPTPRPDGDMQSTNLGWGKRIADVWRNRPARRLVLAWLINGVANGVPAICFPLYLRLVLGVGDEAYGYYLLLYFLAAVISMPLWVVLARHHPKHRVWCWAMILACASFVFVPFLQVGATHWFAVICLLTGLAFGADLALPPAIQADVADWSREATGRDQTGMLFSIWSIATKLAFGLAAGLTFPLLGLFGVSGDASMATEQGLIALVVIYSLFPTVMKMIAISLVWSFSLAYGEIAETEHLQQEM